MRSFEGVFSLQQVPNNKIMDFCQRWKITELSLFGSILRKDFGANSDVDILVSFADDANWSLSDFVEMINELKNIFGREVDLVEKKALRNPFRRHSILSNRKIIYVV